MKPPPAKSPATSIPKGPLYRVGRGDDPLRFATIEAADAMHPHAGNRFDVPGRGVLYLATDEETCFIETLARFRPSPKFRALAKENPGLEPHFMAVGGVPADWRSRRLIVECQVAPDALPFLNVDAVETAEFLNWALSEELAAHDLPLLDHSTIFGPNRLVTRLIASWASSATNDQGICSTPGFDTDHDSISASAGLFSRGLPSKRHVATRSALTAPRWLPWPRRFR